MSPSGFGLGLGLRLGSLIFVAFSCPMFRARHRLQSASQSLCFVLIYQLGGSQFLYTYAVELNAFVRSSTWHSEASALVGLSLCACCEIALLNSSTIVS